MICDPNPSDNQTVDETKNASPSLFWDLLRDAELDDRLEALELTPSSDVVFLLEFRGIDGR